MAQFIDTLLETVDRGGLLAAHAAPMSLQPLVQMLWDGASRREALLNLRKLLAAVPIQWEWPMEGRALTALATVLSSGPALCALLARSPERMDLLLDDSLGQPWSEVKLRRALDRRLREAGVGPDAGEFALERLAEGIACFRNDQYIRLAACEFGLASLEQVGLELANVADACLEAAMSAALAYHLGQAWSPAGQGARGIVAVAMGKHGAQELNFCSDIDLVFIYDTDERTIGGLSSHEFHSGVCREVVKALSRATSEGVAFRVDLRLRPEGSRGPICNSLSSAERYYETWGGAYDRLAWLKARVAAGDEQLGESMVSIIRPFVFPRSTSLDVVEKIQQLSQRIRSELREQRKLVEGWNVKLGEGGIRDVEFFVQALQLLHGGKQVSLRERATLRVLDKLLFAGLISEHERRVLAEAYEFYRRVEHRLQLHGGRQTHLLPRAGRLRQHVAAHMGFSVAAFAEEVQRNRRRVSRVYATLGAEPPASEEINQLLDEDLPAQTHERLLELAGFRHADWAREQLQLLKDKPWGPFARNAEGRLRGLASTLIKEISDAPEPDAALRHLVDMALRIGPLQGPWMMLADNVAATRLLCNLFGSSDFLARLFIGQPELLDQLLLAGRARVTHSAAEMGAEIDRRFEGEEIEGCFGALEQFRNEEVLRIGMHDIAGDLSVEAVWAQLSDLAEQILRRLYALVYGEVERRYGRPRLDGQGEAQMAVVGLGKLGGRELSYGSDLDLIFIYSAEGQTDGERPIDNSEFFAKVAQRLIRALTSAFVHGSLYQVDTRLRPSGSQGTLVSSLAAFERYHREEAHTWERQVLTKARPVAGDEQFGETVSQWIDRFVYGGLQADVVRAEVVRLRERMERELAEEDGEHHNLKSGHGGLLDAEFVAQYLQLCFGGDVAELRTQATLAALRAAREAGLLEEDSVDALVHGYRFLRRLEGRLRIVRGRSAERLPASAAGLELVARRLGYRKRAEQSAGAQLLRDYRETTATIRRAFRRIFTLPSV